MSRKKYSKEEINLIEEWGSPSDLERERKGHVLGVSRTPITALMMAKQRKEAYERFQATNSTSK